MAYERPIFERGKQYRVKQTFQSGPVSTFKAGELLVFERNTYSPYDNSFVYVFQNSQHQIKEWWLPEDQPQDTWRKYFEAISSDQAA
jgi:hypothetical protein